MCCKIFVFYFFRTLGCTRYFHKNPFNLISLGYDLLNSVYLVENLQKEIIWLMECTSMNNGSTPHTL